MAKKRHCKTCKKRSRNSSGICSTCAKADEKREAKSRYKEADKPNKDVPFCAKCRAHTRYRKVNDGFKMKPVYHSNGVVTYSGGAAYHCKHCNSCMHIPSEYSFLRWGIGCFGGFVGLGFWLLLVFVGEILFGAVELMGPVGLLSVPIVSLGCFWYCAYHTTRKDRRRWLQYVNDYESRLRPVTDSSGETIAPSNPNVEAAEPSVQVVDAGKLVERDGLAHEGDSETPFTGIVVAKHSNGQKWFEATYKDGKREGQLIGWYENGQKWQVATFKDGKKKGLMTEWHKNGKKSSEVTYKGDEEVSGTYWDEEGNVITK